MKNALVFVGIGALVIIVGMWVVNRESPNNNDITNLSESSMTDTLTLTSSVFENAASIPSRFTCEGENISPPISWSGVPEGTKSLAIIMDDPDVPKVLKPEGIYNHWTLFNIAPETTEITTGGTAGTSGSNGRGTQEYFGPCPPKEYEPSEHRYFFYLYALDTTLELSEDASKQDVLDAMEGHVLAEAELMGKYKKQ